MTNINPESACLYSVRLMAEFYQDYRGNGSRRHSSPGVDQEGDAAGDVVANRTPYDANVSTASVFSLSIFFLLTLSRE
jgi:hypothetical protein